MSGFTSLTGSDGATPVTSTNPLPVQSVQTGVAADQVQGNVASGAMDSGNPVKAGGVFNGALPTVVNGQRADLQVTSRGTLLTSLIDPTAASNGSVNAFPTSNSNNSVNIIGLASNATAWGYDAGNTSLVKIGATTPVSSYSGLFTVNYPSSSAQVAVTPVCSTAAEASHVIKTAAANLYRVAITTGASGGYLMVFNATSVPADGTVTPQLVRAVPANSSMEIEHSHCPDRYSAGIVVVFSTSGPFTKTASASAMFEVSAL